jgi:hypothetical protein
MLRKIVANLTCSISSSDILTLFDDFQDNGKFQLSDISSDETTLIKPLNEIDKEDTSSVPKKSWISFFDFAYADLLIIFFIFNFLGKGIMIFCFNF